MNLTFPWMQSEWMRALGWTFVHSLWQIALVGFLLFIILRLIPGRSAHIRYMISTMALWMIVMMSLSTFIIMLPDNRHVTELSGKLILVNSAEPLTLANRISAWLEVRMPMMLTIWLGGVAILMMRLALSLGWIKHIRTTAIPDLDIQNTLDQIIQRLNLKINPAASGSGLVTSPVTIGHFKPLILFPIGIINQLTPAEVEAVLTHELAHIVRRDYLSNLIQSFIETLFYYHPVTWWISRMVRTERENRADDLAISWCGDHLGYVKALMTVQEMQAACSPSLAIGFASGKGAMLVRIKRILNVPYKNHNKMEKTVLLSLCSLCFLAFTFTGQADISNLPDKLAATTPMISVLEEKTDSLPTKGIYRIHKKTDDQDISIEVEDGSITELKVDGREIQPAEYDDYGEVIDDLFGEVEAPPAMEGFEFTFTPMPPMPPMPMMEGFAFEMPPMPPMPEIPMMELERLRLFELEHLNHLGNGVMLAPWNEEGSVYGRMLMDTTPDGATKIIIINGNDSSVVCMPHAGFGMTFQGTPGADVETFMLDKEAMKQYEEQWKAHSEQWREEADQWRKHQQEWREQWREQSNEQREQQEMLRKELRGHEYWSEDQQRELERELGRADEEMARVYELKMPRLSLSDEMVRDGLVEPGDEVEIQLTTDKLKINGEKMPDNIHQKYLRMYEQQQGVELSGNSRVEFTTKSKQRM